MARKKRRHGSKAAGSAKTGGSSPSTVSKPRAAYDDLTVSLHALEPRFMFDAAGVATGADVADTLAQKQAEQAVESTADANGSPANDTAFSSTESVAGGHDAGANAKAPAPASDNELLDALAAVDPPSARREIIFIDSAVQDYQRLIAGIESGAQVVMLDPNRDGVEQNADVLSQYDDIDAVHIVAHGDAARLQLGNAALTLASMSGEHADELAIIGGALAEDADILVYGCNFGEGGAGRQAAGTLAAHTGADMAASDDLTGSAALGDDWELEYQVGDIETPLVVGDLAQQEYQHLLITSVNTGNGAVWIGVNNGLYSLDVTTGKVTLVTTSPFVAGIVNSIATDITNGLVYYTDTSGLSPNVTLYAYDYINDQHITVDNDLRDKGVTVGSQGIGNAGASFANGSLYLAVENCNQLN